ncbi:MAG: radical SAM protein [Polyangiaceae bacterium]|nr:radical SAM protein [Polyangiaceae bacterium]
MGILHRAYARHAPSVWEAETRLLHAFRLVRRPVAAQWLVTNACDLACPHCYSHAGKRGAHELTTSEAKALVVDELVALGKPLFVLAGGELLLRRDIPELVDYACERGLAWAMHTHGLHVPRFRQLLRRHPPALAAISLDGDRALHDGFRGRAGSFDGALEAIRVLRETGCREIVAGTTITRHSADAVADLFPIVAASGADSWGLHLFAPEGRGAEHQALVPTPEQLARVAAFGRRMRQHFHVELCNEWGSAGCDDVRYRDQPWLCGAGRISFVVSPGGEVLPCTTTDLSESEGNVRDTPLRTLWARGFGRFRTGGHGDCSDGRTCWLQARNGCAPGVAAFGEVARAEAPRHTPLVERLPRGRARASRTTREARLAGPMAVRATRAAALVAVFLEACVARTKPEPGAPGEGSASASAAAPPTGPTASAPASAAAPGATVAIPAVPGASESASASAPPDAPPAVTVGSFPALDEAGLARHFRLRGTMTAWRALVVALSELVPRRSLAEQQELAQSLGPKPSNRLASALLAHLERRDRDVPDTAAELLLLLDAAEQHPIFDGAFAAYLWQRTGELPLATAGTTAQTFLMRLERYRQVSAALEAGARAVGRVEYRAWLSKAGPPPGWEDRVIVPAGLLPAARSSFASAPAPRWRVGAMTLTVTEGAVTLVPPGAPARSVAAGASFALYPLELLRADTPVKLDHPLVGALELPAGTEVSVLTLAGTLGAAGRSRLAELVANAGAGDGAARAAVEANLALAARDLRAFLRAHPDAPGASRLFELATRLMAPE